MLKVCLMLVLPRWITSDWATILYTYRPAGAKAVWMNAFLHTFRPAGAWLFGVPKFYTDTAPLGLKTITHLPDPA